MLWPGGTPSLTHRPVSLLAAQQASDPPSRPLNHCPSELGTAPWRLCCVAVRPRPSPADSDGPTH